MSGLSPLASNIIGKTSIDILKVDQLPIRQFYDLDTETTFTELQVDSMSICGWCSMSAGNAYPFRHMVSCIFLDLHVLLLLGPFLPHLSLFVDFFKLRISHGTFSILLCTKEIFFSYMYTYI